MLPTSGQSGCAQLTHYTVSYREWGEGPPLILIPGLAGGYGLLGVPDIHPAGPLACLAGGLVIAGAGALTIRRHPSQRTQGKNRDL